MSEISCLPNLHKVLMSHKYCVNCAYKCYFLPCGENVGKENRKTLVECTLRGFLVPGAGIEPARIAPLVFETSASTDSAIRAGVHIVRRRALKVIPSI